MKRSTRYLWGAALFAGLFSTLLLAAGFITGVKDILHPVSASGRSDKLSNPPPSAGGIAAESKIQIAAVGDSLTKGYGDASGKGYVGDVRDLLAAKLQKPVYIIGNLAVTGYRSGQLLHDLNHEPGVIHTLSQANLILLTIGGNDLTLLAENQNSDVPDLNFKSIIQKLPQAENRLSAIFARLEKINTKATIVYVELYNPFLDLDKKRQSSVAIMRYNEKAFELANQYPNFVAVPTYDLFEKHLNRYLFTDHFHPNQEGYKAIADRILEVLE